MRRYVHCATIRTVGGLGLFPLSIKGHQVIEIFLRAFSIWDFPSGYAASASRPTMAILPLEILFMASYAFGLFRRFHRTKRAIEPNCSFVRCRWREMSERKFINFDIQIDRKIERAFGSKKANLNPSRDPVFVFEFYVLVFTELVVQHFLATDFDFGP
jgi:hypothetical protein